MFPFCACFLSQVEATHPRKMFRLVPPSLHRQARRLPQSPHQVVLLQTSLLATFLQLRWLEEAPPALVPYRQFDWKAPAGQEANRAVLHRLQPLKRQQIRDDFLTRRAQQYQAL